MIGVDSAGNERTLMDLLKHSLGEELLVTMADSRVMDLVVNPGGAVFVRRRGEPWREAGFRRPSALTHTAIMTIGTLTRTVVDQDQPYLSAQVPGYGWRVQGVLPPVVTSPQLVLRKPPEEIYPLSSYRDEGRCSEAHFVAIRDAVITKRNIVVSGPTGSGKTTVLNACVALMRDYCAKDRIVIIEDTEEIQCALPNRTQMLVRPPHTMKDALRQVLRMIPTRIVFGELRGAEETAALLRAWGSGHPGGLTSVHAASARGALLQIEDYVLDAPGAGIRRKQIASHVHIVVQVVERRIEEVVQLHEELAPDGGFQCTEITP